MTYEEAIVHMRERDCEQCGREMKLDHQHSEGRGGEPLRVLDWYLCPLGHRRVIMTCEIDPLGPG